MQVIEPCQRRGIAFGLEVSVCLRSEHVRDHLIGASIPVSHNVSLPVVDLGQGVAAVPDGLRPPELRSS